MIKKQPYIQKRQIITILLLFSFFIYFFSQKVDVSVLIFLGHYFVVVVFMVCEPVSYYKLKYPRFIHFASYCFPMYICFPYLFIHRRPNIYNIQVIIFLAVMFVILLVSNLKKIYSIINGIQTKMPINRKLIIYEIYSLMLPIVSEEIFFRGTIFVILSDWNYITLIFFSAILFSFTHYLNRWSNIMLTCREYISLFILGGILAGLYYYTGSIIICIMVHCIYNCSSFIVLYKRFFVKENEESLF